MITRQMYVTSESVTAGHPDKICDQIADAILDQLLKNDPQARVACEVCATTGMVLVFGEITTEDYCDIPTVVRETIREIGYNDSSLGFSADNCAVLTSIKEQSHDIALGVDHSLESKQGGSDTLGAGDQGMMYGYATDETPNLMPLPIELAHQLTARMAQVRQSGEAKTFCPDGKAMVTVVYEDGKPMRLDTVLVSTQHQEKASQEEVQKEVRDLVLAPILPKNLVDEQTKILINPTGSFVVGGPAGDSGLTGRKIIVDTYGGFVPHGGGSFSGKDSTKVDRSGAYMARYLAKNVVASGLAKQCETSLAYAIGVADPVSFEIDCKGTATVPEEQIRDWLLKNVDMTPSGIIQRFGLRKPIFKQTASNGHFGHEDFPWEKRDLAAGLRQDLS